MGLAYGMAETLAAASTLLAPPLAGWLYSRDPSLMYQTALALIAMSIVITLASVPRSRVLPPDHVELMVET
jgi:hypothetical protein